MPRLESNDQGPAPAFSFWLCLAVQVMTEGLRNVAQALKNKDKGLHNPTQGHTYKTPTFRILQKGFGM